MAYFSPADCHNQRVCWQITEPDGSQTTKAVLEPTGAITAVSDGDILLTARSVAFPEITGTAVLHISGLGQPSLAVDAQVTSSDYYEGYDKRCYPWRAVNGITDNYSGWCSAALCSEEAPVYLYIDLRQEKVFCQIDLYTTSLAASLPSRIAQTTKDWPLCMSPAANTFATLVPYSPAGVATLVLSLIHIFRTQNSTIFCEILQ